MKVLGWRIIPIVVFSLLCLFLWRGLSLDPHHLPSVQVGKAVPQFSLPQLGSSHIVDSKQLQGQVSLLNVWASWCSACVEEQVFMMHLAQEGVIIYGLNYKDDAQDALSWLTQWGNPYKLVMRDAEGRVAIDLGVYGAPETFVIDKQGIIRYRHVGIMNQEVWDKELYPLVQQLERA
jgi:cytochrome c biogenesis protein CcmG/thiol:disulfide interchange protein DsbE